MSLSSASLGNGASTTRSVDPPSLGARAVTVRDDEIDAYLLLTMCGKVRLGNMVDPKYTLAASISKAIVAAHRA